VVEQLKSEYGAQVEWLPFLLRPNLPEQGEELPSAIRARSAQSRSRLEQLAQAQGLPMATLNWISNPRLAHEATEYAREKDKAEEFHHIVLRKYYGEGQDIGQWDVLRASAVEAGLDADDMQRSVETGAYRAIVEDQLADAYALGINSVPTYVLNDRYAIIGAQPYPVFKQVIERLAGEQEQDIAGDEPPG
jgi:predicted DsbA family dithiol-disulfide isomerase